MNNTIFFICSVIIFRTPTGHKWSSRQSSILSVVPPECPGKISSGLRACSADKIDTSGMQEKAPCKETNR
ncbi:hypothetical protein [Culturomica massiliensis]|uniref:hypothetical protein n=1 Tax=Culturomica massiliensis TaxID=1841857 RepID=UPI000838B002|nr:MULTISPECIES: hypothetical protein [Odoribacteraceae]